MEAIPLVGTPIGFIIGLVLLIVPIKLISDKDFGDFRLVLVTVSNERQQEY